MPETEALEANERVAGLRVPEPELDGCTVAIERGYSLSVVTN